MPNLPQRLDLKYAIEWQSAWHVGSGYQGAAADRLVHRMEGYPFVPGSQVKGVLRHHCECLAATLGCKVIDPHTGGQPQEGREYINHFVPLQKSELVIDRLFGSRYQGECLFVSNAVLANTNVLANSKGKSTFEVRARTAKVRARTAMDRVTGTVKEGHLFTTEVSNRNIHLEGFIRARHPAGVLTSEEEGGFPLEYGLLVSGLLSLGTLGGDKSIGQGRCKVDVQETKWNGDQIEIDFALKGLEEPEWCELLQILR